jgi:ketosteroid isomerase-like protein
MPEVSENTLKVAHQGFANLQHGLATGKWEPLLDMLTEDFWFWFPTGPYQGLNQGKESAQAFFNYVSEVFDNSIRLTSIERITSNETTVVFEFRDQGILKGELYKNRIAVSFDIRGDKICGYREYMGSDGKSH